MSQQSPRVLCARPVLALENPCAIAGCAKPRVGGHSMCPDHLAKDRRQKARRRAVAIAQAGGRAKKRCSRCGIEKDLVNEFYVSRGSPDGRQSRCRACDNTKEAPVRPRAKPTEPPRAKRPKPCRMCADVKWRRPVNGRCVCGGEYEAESTVRAVDFADQRRASG